MFVYNLTCIFYDLSEDDDIPMTVGIFSSEQEAKANAKKATELIVKKFIKDPELSGFLEHYTPVGYAIEKVEVDKIIIFESESKRFTPEQLIKEGRDEF